MEFPVRINKYLAHKQICSRKEADKLIQQGLVLINGKKAQLGQKVEKSDTIKLNRAHKKIQKEKVYLLFNKPKGIVTVNAQGAEQEIKDIVELDPGVVPIGRLDKLSTGLVLLSNDGRITARLLSPDYNHSKEYKVKVNKNIRQGFFEKAKIGIELEGGYVTKPAKIQKLGPRAFRIVLTEGKHHQIRRMCAAFGYEVLDLQRTAILNFLIGDLKSGQLRRLTNQEQEELLTQLGVTNS